MPLTPSALEVEEMEENGRMAVLMISTDYSYSLGAQRQRNQNGEKRILERAMIVVYTQLGKKKTRPDHGPARNDGVFVECR
jgi:hypothetical protein